MYSIYNLTGLSFDIGEKLVPNLWEFITQLLAFLIMVLIVYKLAYKPVRKFLKSRNAFIKGNLESAQKQNISANQANEKAQKNLNQSRKEAINIVMDAKRQAEEEKGQVIEETKREIAQKRIEAEKDIENQKQKAMEEVHDKIVDIALSASSNLLSREVSSSDNKKLVSQFVDDMQQDNKEASK
ncbi:MAG: F0F1 ATP synthase subunit B [Bacilli bacterium]|nr:F0F1 ATP synthase subunit B [Bacilli bacterium]